MAAKDGRCRIATWFTEEEKRALMKLAKRQRRSMAGTLRILIVKELQLHGLLQEEDETVANESVAQSGPVRG